MQSLAAVVAATDARPSGGAPLDQLAVLVAVNLGATAALLWLIQRHWAGRTDVLTRGAAAAGWLFRLPGWAALPILVAVLSLLLTMFGGFWDIGYHIDVGRDEGPLGNAGHWPMLFGFYGVFVAGILCVALTRYVPPAPGWVRLTDEWHAPVGGLLLIACGIFALLALPLDDVWHRIFGQDVTLWSPTHFMLLAGGTFAVIGQVVLVADAARLRERPAAAGNGNGAGNGSAAWATIPLFGGSPFARLELLRGREAAQRLGRIWGRAQRFVLLGGMLVGLEAFLAEYDWGVPLYRQVWQPLLLAAFASFVFVAARAWAGRGAALGAWGSYVVVRSLASLMPVLAGRSAAAFPLFLAEAVCVELIARRVDPERRPLAFGAVAGLLVGTVGFAAEYAWTQLAMPLPWTPALLAEGIPTAALAGIAGGIIGALLAAGLRSDLPPRRTARIACAGSFALLIALGVNAGIRTLPDSGAEFTLTDVAGGDGREAIVTARMEPTDAAEDANWFYVLAWQGGEDRVVAPMERVGDGIYRSSEPVPLSGTWKAGLRLNAGRERGAIPLRLPADPGIEGSDEYLATSFTDADAATDRIKSGAAGAELAAPASFERVFLDDNLIVLREQNGGVSRWIWGIAIAVIAAFYVLFVAGLAVGVGRFARASGGRAGKREEGAERGSRPAPSSLSGVGTGRVGGW